MPEAVIATEGYLLRPLTEADISPEWASWLSDPETARRLNLLPRQFKESELRDYLKRFDQDRSVLLGVFEKASEKHIGLITVHVSDGGEDALLNVLIGDKHRIWSGLRNIRGLRIAVGDYLFSVRKFRSAYASAVGDNREMIAYLRSAGWVVVKRQIVPDPHAAGARELMVFQLTADAWRERNHTTLPENF